MNDARKIAHNLLQIKAIKLNTTSPFVWASGWNSPIYCDNRKTLYYPAARKEICEAFVRLIHDKYSDVEVIAGVATGAIAHGMLVAEAMGLPFVYVRSAPKAHGLENLIEGEIPEGKQVVIVEDLISTGGSSLAAFDALCKSGAKVLGMAAIFTYAFEKAYLNFEKSACTLHTLSNYNVLIEEAVKTGYVREEQLDTLKKWRESPDTWMK